MIRPSRFRISCVWLFFVISMSACAGPKSTPPAQQEQTSIPGRISNFQENVREKEEHPGRALLWLGDQEVWLEVASDSKSRGLGLGRRKSLARDEGMIFVYEDADFRSFWMKDTWVPLDIAFVSNDMLITQIVSLDPPAANCSDADLPRAKSQDRARYVVEMQKGWFERKGVGVGDHLRFSSQLQSRIKGGK